MKQWVSDLATTNFRIVISLTLAVLLVLTMLVALVLGVELQTEIVWALVAFVAGMLGIDVTQFSIKRNTTLVTPPQTTAENATATTVANAPPAPVLTKADADQAAALLEESRLRAARGGDVG